MAKETMLTYLDQRLTKKITDYDVALDWDRRNNTIEVVFRLFAENQQHLQIDDAEGVASEEEVIEFEDGILLFDPQKSKFDEEDYLAAIPYEGKKGIQQAILDGLVDYLKDVLDQGQSDLLDFLDEDSEAEVFELKWDNEVLMELMTAYQQKDGQNMIPYPSF